MSADINQELRLMVALDLSRMDEILIEYVNYLSTIWKISHVDFVHNVKQTELHNIYDEIADEKINIEDLIKKELNREVEEWYKGTSAYQVIVASENYTESVFSLMAKEQKTDIMIVGKKGKLKGTGAMSQKLVRMLTCDMLLVPESVKHNMEHLLIPTDFTNNSAKAFQCAKAIQNQNQSNLHALHVYNIPSVYFPYIDREKAMDRTEKHLNDKYVAFLRRNKLENIPFALAYHDELSVVGAIRRYAERENMDIIIVSARGGNKITSLFIGSITNELLSEDLNSPVLVVK